MDGPASYFIIQAVAALVLFASGVPFAMKKVKPNVWSGFRTKRTLSNPEVWYRVNRDMGYDLMVLGAVYGILVFAAYVFRESLGFGLIWIGLLVILFVGLGLMVFRGFRTMGKM